MIATHSRNVVSLLSRTTCLTYLAALIFLASLAVTSSASALGIVLTPVGGSATGRVGDTLQIGIDLVVEDGEFVTSLDPVLQWDLEGGNVLDITRAQTLSVVAGGIPLNPIVADRWRLLDPTLVVNGTGDVGEFIDGTLNLDDQRQGATALVGLELASFVFEDDILEAYQQGVSAAGIYRVGVVDFLLRETGTTTISYLTDSRFPFSTFFAGPGFTPLPNDGIALTPLDVSSTSLAALAIVVVPEPGTALLFGIGLALLSSGRNRD